MDDVLGYLRKLAIDIISPPSCVGCYQFLDERLVLCAACLKTLQPVVAIPVQLARNYTMMVHAAGVYEGILRRLVLAKNYGNRAASVQLAHIIWNYSNFRYLSADYLVPVPLHWRRYASRGFNQAEVIAHELAAYSGARVVPLVRRIRFTVPQAELTAEERARNVRDVFALADQGIAIKNKHIVLVDDLMTTGATLTAVANLFVSYQPASIAAIVACRT